MSGVPARAADVRECVFHPGAGPLLRRTRAVQDVLRVRQGECQGVLGQCGGPRPVSVGGAVGMCWCGSSRSLSVGGAVGMCWCGSSRSLSVDALLVCVGVVLHDLCR